MVCLSLSLLHPHILTSNLMQVWSRDPWRCARCTGDGCTLPCSFSGQRYLMGLSPAQHDLPPLCSASSHCTCAVLSHQDWLHCTCVLGHQLHVLCHGRCDANGNPEHHGESIMVLSVCPCVLTVVCLSHCVRLSCTFSLIVSLSLSLYYCVYVTVSPSHTVIMCMCCACALYVFQYTCYSAQQAVDVLCRLPCGRSHLACCCAGMISPLVAIGSSTTSFSGM